MYHQPYSMHLLLGNCMFGCQMEAELVINFLLQAQPYGTEDLEVLPIVGLGKVGKGTLLLPMFARMKGYVLTSQKSTSCMTVILEMMSWLLSWKDVQ
jgi:hypothetical protein